MVIARISERLSTRPARIFTFFLNFSEFFWEGDQGGFFGEVRFAFFIDAEHGFDFLRFHLPRQGKFSSQVKFSRLSQIKLDYSLY